MFYYSESEDYFIDIGTFKISHPIDPSVYPEFSEVSDFYHSTELNRLLSEDLDCSDSSDCDDIEF